MVVENLWEYRAAFSMDLCKIKWFRPKMLESKETKIKKWTKCQEVYEFSVLCFLTKNFNLQESAYTKDIILF